MEEYKQQVITEALEARQKELFHYNFDRANFLYMIDRLPVGDEYRDRLVGMVSEIDVQVSRLQLLIEALEAQR